MFALKSLGLLSTAPLLDADNLKTWSQLLQRHGSLPLDLKGNIDNSALVTALSSKGVKDAKRAVQALRWLDVLGEREINRKQQDSPMDILCTRLMEALKFDAHERDLVVMYHSVTAEFGDGKMEEHNSWLLMTGNERHSAMAATVGYTCGAAAELLLSGQVEQKGVLVPIVKGIYFPILQRLAGLGITFGESISK
jgi:saccharopine dehydrogenase (NADP+, L-glutamate forming)